MESTLAFCAATGGYPLYWYMLSLEKAMVIWFGEEKCWRRFRVEKGV
jgi:hypothetical protein